MNNKGQMAMVGTMIVLFVGVIIALAIYTGGIAPAIGDSTLTKDTVLATTNFTTTAKTLNGQAVTTVAVINASDGASVPATNYTVANYVLTNGELSTTITAKAGIFANKNVNISYTYEPLGYAKDSSSRTMINLIAIFAALGVVGFIIKKIIDDGLFDGFK